MNRFLFRAIAMATIACAATSLRAAGPFGELSKKRRYPSFSIGVTGISATIEPGRIVLVDDVREGSPAAPYINIGDVLRGIGGRDLAVPDPRIVLGRALGEAEVNGRLRIDFVRAGMPRKARLTIPKLGAYAATWGQHCAKTSAIIAQTAAYLISAQNEGGGYAFDGKQADRDGLQACLAGLFLLSTGEPMHLEHVRRQVHGLAEQAATKPTTSMWILGYRGILLAEYYLATGDRDVLPALESLCRQATQAQAAGGWSHHGAFGPGYVQSGLMNSAGVPVLTTMILARECGVAVDEKSLLAALKLFYRMVGHGHVAYGDHRAELWWPNTNGRNAMLACALSLLDEERYQRAAEHLALVVADSYYAPEFGHTGGGFNVIWRGLGSVHVAKARESNYERQMQQLAWYYDLARLPIGGFSMLPSPPDTTRYCGVAWGTGAIGLTYTAPQHRLRITGAPRSKYSVPYRPLAMDWGSEADLAFLRSEGAADFGRETTPPDDVYRRLVGRDKKTTTVEFAAKQLRHANPAIRSWAARWLGERGDAASIEAIALAAMHADPRVRRAAYDAVSGYDNWSAPRRTKIDRSVVSERVLPAILKTLDDPRSAWWELDGALFALGRARASDIHGQLATIQRFARHEEWYIRQAAFWALVGLGSEIAPSEFQFLTEIYARESHVFARASFDGGFDQLLSRDHVKLGADAERRAVETLGRTLHSAPIAAGYEERGIHEAAHRTMMILKHFDRRVDRYLIPDFERYLKIWNPGFQHSRWLIIGSKWQPGLIKVLEGLGDGADRLRCALAEVLEKKLPPSVVDGPGPEAKADREVREALEKALEHE